MKKAQPGIAHRIDHVQFRRRHAACETSCDGQQSRRRSGTGHAGEQEMPVAARPCQGPTALMIGIIDDANRVEVGHLRPDDVVERRQPWPIRRRNVVEPRGLADCADEQIEVGRSRAGRLERDQLIDTETHDRAAWHRAGQRGRARIADHVRGVGAILDPQCDPQIGVGPDVIADHPMRPLRRQQQMHAETSAALGDAEKSPDEARLRHREAREFIDNDDQPRESTGVVQRPVPGEVARAGIPQQSLATTQFGLEAAQRPRRQPVIEVRHEANGVRQIRAGVERRATLVVHEHERDVVGTRACGETHHEVAQQFTLAGAGRAGEQTVRPVGDEIDLDHAVGRDTDRRTRRRIAAARRPQRRDTSGVRGRVATDFVGEQFDHGDLGRQCRATVAGFGVDETSDRGSGLEGAVGRDSGDL